MAAAGLGDDLLLANEVLDPRRLGALGALVAAGTARVTAAVDSPETVDAVAAAGLREVLVDVNVGLPRCGCDPGDAGVLAERARAAGLEVRGVMGYEGHLMREPHDRKAAAVEAAMKILLDARDRTGGDVVSAGGTGTYDVNPWATEIQAGSYVLMDTEYVPHAPAFGHALSLWTTVVSVNPAGWAVADCGLKSLGMDHGDPTVVDVGRTWFTSDEHVTFGTDGDHPLRAGDRVRVLPAHVDPTVAMHEQMVVVDGTTADADVLTTWPVDLRGW
jgi:D-serine deaminase-like pyridoxal phosphate-dependent protein